MRPVTSVLVLTLLPSCAFFEKAVDTFEGLTNPLVGLGFVLSVEPAQSGDVDLSDSEVPEGTTVTVMLADAARVNDLDQVPVLGAEVACHDIVAVELGEGLYAIEPGQLSYQPGTTWDLDVTIGDDVATASVDLPDAASWTAPQTHVTGGDLVVDLSGQGYDSALVIVMDGQSGDITWSNEPRTAREVYDFTHRSTDALAVTVPGAEAFPTDSIYFVGVSGMIHTGASDLDQMNTALSTFMAGKMIVHPVSTFPTM